MGHDAQNQLAVPARVDQTSSSTSQRYGYLDHNVHSVVVLFQTHLVIHLENCVLRQMNYVVCQSRAAASTTASAMSKVHDRLINR